MFGALDPQVNVFFFNGRPEKGDTFHVVTLKIQYNHPHA